MFNDLNLVSSRVSSSADKRELRSSDEELLEKKERVFDRVLEKDAPFDFDDLLEVALVLELILESELSSLLLMELCSLLCLRLNGTVNIVQSGVFSRVWGYAAVAI